MEQPIQVSTPVACVDPVTGITRDHYFHWISADSDDVECSTCGMVVHNVHIATLKEKYRQEDIREPWRNETMNPLGNGDGNSLSQTSENVKPQVGGNHYRLIPGEQHWDRAHRLGLDYHQGQITKYVERWRDKNGIEDLKKAQQFLNHYIELQEQEQYVSRRMMEVGADAGPGYTKQD